MKPDFALDKRLFMVGDAPLPDARRLIETLHYSKTCPGFFNYVHGLFKKDDPLRCVGVAWWGDPTPPQARANWHGAVRDVIVLSRLVIAPGMPTNAASFLLAASTRIIRKDGRFRCLLTYADEAQGHTGAIYRAANWEYCGLTKRTTRFLDGQGRLRTKRPMSTGSLRHAQMVAAGYRIEYSRKHKFRMILPAKAKPTQVPLLQDDWTEQTHPREEKGTI